MHHVGIMMSCDDAAVEWTPITEIDRFGRSCRSCMIEHTSLISFARRLNCPLGDALQIGHRTQQPWTCEQVVVDLSHL